MKKILTAADFMPLDAYEKVREAKRAAMIERKKKRRVSVGPYATFYFENYDTMWLQVQEMLRIEKGGDEQMQDELRAYNPLLPQGNELVATVMFEIADPDRRREVLAVLGGVEKSMELRFAGETVKGVPEQDLDYTSEEGKASSVQFVHFRMTPQQAEKCCNAEWTLAITHPQYGHMALVPQAVKEELVKDISS